jgi:hypothetical protein
MSPLGLFHMIIQNLEQRYAHLERGHVLSAPAIEYKGRAFAFCQRGNMVVKLEDTEQFARQGVPGAQELRPFNRNAGSQWREVPYYFHADWPALCEMALDAMRQQIDIPDDDI